MGKHEWKLCSLLYTPSPGKITSGSLPHYWSYKLIQLEGLAKKYQLQREEREGKDEMRKKNCVVSRQAGIRHEAGSQLWLPATSNGNDFPEFIPNPSSWLSDNNWEYTGYHSVYELEAQETAWGVRGPSTDLDFYLWLGHCTTLDTALHAFWWMAITNAAPNVRAVSSMGIIASVLIGACWYIKIVCRTRVPQSDTYSIFFICKCQTPEYLPFKLSCSSFLCEINESLVTTLNYK